MSFLKKIFGGKDEAPKTSKGFKAYTVTSIDRLTKEAVKINLAAQDGNTPSFKAGQYVNIELAIDGKKVRRAYSICNGEDEGLAIGVKEVPGGLMSSYLNQQLQTGATVDVSAAEGSFTLREGKHFVAFAAGSGITPILSIAKKIEQEGKNLRLFYGNRSEESILFKSTLDALTQTSKTYFLSQESKEGYENRRLDKTSITEMIKADLSLLKADGFYLCGPEDLIHEAKDTLQFFGVSSDKIHYELFKTPVAATEKIPTKSFEGTTKLTVILDKEKTELTFTSKDNNLLYVIENDGLDAPYSCRGGVCCSCKAKVLSGSAEMKLNFSLTDEEVAEGYILTCQASPSSEELTISFDA